MRTRRGSALITVLLLLVLLTVLAAQIAMRASVDSRATENRLTDLQAQIDAKRSEYAGVVQKIHELLPRG